LPVTRQSPFVIELSDDERVELEALVRKPTAQHRMVLRARIVLCAADGWENVVIADWLDVTVNTVSKWRKRFFEERIPGLKERKRSGRPRKFPPSGHCRGKAVGVRVAGHHRGAAFPVELLGTRPRTGGAGHGGRHLGLDDLADPA
jgi:hypothetical protein